MTTFTSTISSTTPLLVDGFESSSDTGNIIHRLANGTTNVTFRAHGLRTGTLRLVYDDEQESRDAELMFASGDIFTAADPARPSIDMTFVVAGRITRQLERDTSKAWIVSVDFEEILA